MTITFPDGVNLAQSTLTCTSIFGFSTTGTLTCARNSNTVLKITTGFPNSDKYLLFQLNNLKLPSYANTFAITVQTYDKNNNLIDNSEGQTFKFTSLAGALDLTLQSLTSQKVADYTSLQATVKVSNTLASTGYLQMKFPKWNSGTQTISYVKSMIKYSNSDLQNNQYKIDCSATGHPNLVCMLQVIIPGSSSAIASTYDILKISGFAGDISSTLTFTLTNNRFRNPPSTKPITSITIESYNSLGLVIDQQKSAYSFQITLPIALETSRVTIQAAVDKEINKESQYNFRIQTPLPLPIGTIMYITIPKQVKIVSPTTLNLLLNSAVGFSPLYSVIQVAIQDLTAQTIKLSNMIPTSDNYVDSDSTVQFSLLQLRNPPTTTTTDAFKLQFYDQEFLIMESDSVTLNADPGELTNCAVTPDNYRTRLPALYAFSFGISNSLQSDSSITIYIPKEISVTTASLKFNAVQSISSTATITYISTTRIITIKSPFPSGITAPVVVKFEITAGLTNPLTSKETEAFIISTLDGSGNTLDSNSEITITPTPNEIPTVIATACINNQAQSYTSQVCTYQIRIYTGQNYPILPNSYIEIDLPDDLAIQSMTSTLKYSYSEGLQDSKLVMSSPSAKTLQFKGVFTPADNSVTQFVYDMFTVYVGNVTTPRSTEPASSFHARIVDSSGNVQYKKDSLIESQVSQARPFTKALVKRTSELNGASNVTYEFTVVTSLPVFRNEYIKITPPSAISIVSTRDQCQGIQGLQSLLPCSVKDGSLFVNILPSSDIPVNPISQQIAAQTLFRFTVSNLQNPLSLEPTDSYAIFISTSRIYDYYVNGAYQGLGLLNSETGTLKDVQILVDSKQLNVTTNYAFYFTTTNVMPSNSYIEVEFPRNQYQNFTSQQLCQPIRNLPSTLTINSLRCRPHPLYKNILQITNGFNGTNLSSGQVIAFRALSVRNPTKATTDTQSQFIIRTMTANNFIIDQTTTINFQIGCAYPCATCSSVATQCSSCINEDEMNPFYLFQGQCGKQCPTGYYDDNLLTCQKCNFPCSNCMGSASSCTSCKVESGSPFVNDKDGKCYQNCPSGTYMQESSQSCQSCASPCQDCSEKPDKCLSCMSNYYFWESACFSTCPNTSIPLKTNQAGIKECQSCKKPCYTCSGTRDNCTSCQLSPVAYYLYQSECVEECPEPYLPDDSNVCVKMDEPVYPFLSLIFTIPAIIIILVSNRIYPRTRLFTALIAIESVLMLFLWIYLVGFLLKDRHKSSAGIVLIGIILNYLFNVLWYLYYRKKILPLDTSYQMYVKYYPKTQRAIVILSVATTFQLFRLQYTRLFNSKYLSCTFRLKEKYYQKLNRYSLLQITFVYLPVIAANIYNLNWTWYGRQVFWIDIECIITSVILLAAHIVVLIRTEHQYTQDKYEEEDGGSVTMRTQQLAQTSLDTTPRDMGGYTQDGIGEGGTNNGVETEFEKVQRKNALGKIINKVKGNKDNADVLGFTQEESLTDLVYGVDGTDRKRVVDGDKHYQSVGAFYQKRPQTADLPTTAFKKGHRSAKKGSYNYNHQIDDNSLDVTGGGDGGNANNGNGQGYNRLQQESSRDNTQIINELEFTSAPLNADEILKGNSQIQEKHKQFQKEIEEMHERTDKSGRRSPLKAKGSQSNQNNMNYHTLGMPYDESRDNVSDNIGSHLGVNLAHNILNNVVGNQSHADDDEGDYSAEGPNNAGDYFHSNNLKQPNSGQKPPASQEEDFDEIFKDLESNQHGNGVDDLEFSIIKKRLDHRAIQGLKKDIELQKDAKQRQESELDNLKQEVNKLETDVVLEASRKDELQVVVYDLQQQIKLLLQEFEDEKRRKEEELQFIEEGHYTSSEEEMGVSPSSYNVLNQRFSDQADLKIYLNMIGQAEAGANEERLKSATGGNRGVEYEPSMAHSVNGNDNNRQIQSQEQSRRSRTGGNDNGGLSGDDSQNRRSRVGMQSRNSGKIVPLNNDSLASYDSQNIKNLKQSGVNDQLSHGSLDGQDYDDDKLNQSVTMTKEEFFKMLEHETKLAIQNMKSAKTKEDKDFANYAEQLLQQLKNDYYTNNFKGDKKLIDYIRELDKRERKQIEEKYRKIFLQSKEMKKRLKKKSRSKSRPKRQVDNGGKYDPYFRYLPFEKAVIESNGKTPYDNKEVEKIVKQKSSINENMTALNVSSISGISPITMKRGQSTIKSKISGFTLNTKPVKRDSQTNFSQMMKQSSRPFQPDQVEEENSQDLFEGLPAANDEKGMNIFLQNMMN